VGFENNTINEDIISCGVHKILSSPTDSFGRSIYNSKPVKRKRKISINRATGVYSDTIHDEVDYYSAMHFYPEILNQFETRVVGLRDPNEVGVKVLKNSSGICSVQPNKLF
jgi:predicted metal-dependent phosphotriesterase family hydrolase